MTDRDAVLWGPASGSTDALFVPDNSNSFHTSEMVAGFSHIVGILWEKCGNSGLRYHLFSRCKKWCKLGNLSTKKPTFQSVIIVIGSGGWNRTNGLQVMSLTSYHCSTPQRYVYNIMLCRTFVKSYMQKIAFFNINTTKLNHHTIYINSFQPE